MGFEGRHVVVTGGTGALGRAVVERLVAGGAICHVPVHDPAEVAGFALAGHARVRLVSGLSLIEEADVEAFYRDLPALWASIQVVGGFAMAPVLETRGDEFRRLMDLNALTCFLACREAVRAIRRTGHAAGQPGGRLVNVAARPALAPTGGMVAYTAAKAAVVAITGALAEELRREGILVNAVAPSIMDTPANRAAMPGADPDRWPTVAAVAAVMVDLASPNNVLTTGLTMPVYGQA